jgi:3-oxoacyl-[acyl-carrier-protein] synthase-3
VGEVTAYDLGGSGCAGFVLGLDIARSRALSTHRPVLVIGVELLTRLMNWKDRNTCVLFGDAAGAAIVGEGPGAAEILAATAGTDGTRSDILGLEVGGTRMPFTEERAREGLHQNIVMHGREVFKEAVRRMTAASNEVLAQAGVGIDDVALVVPHQANKRILDAVGDRLGVPTEKVFVNVQEYGNTGSASVPVALCEARDQGRIEPGDLVLLTAFGAGFHWAAVLVRF